MFVLSKLNCHARFFLLGLILCIGYDLVAIHTSNSLTNGTIRVPLAWCPVNGSPAVSDPNIPNPWGGVDRTTDDILWRRHERVTDDIYLPQGTGITFRSGVLNPVQTSLHYPTINDPNEALGSPGNVTVEDTHRVEFNAMINNCVTAWRGLSGSGTVSGIPVINIRRFVHNDGTLDDDLIGKSACIKSSAGSSCNEPWNGYVFVIDNCYTAVGATCGWNNDPHDQNLAHELGHALGLNHRDQTGALMAEEQQEDGPGGTVNNLNVNAAEITSLRSNAALVPNSEIDPNNNTTKGHIVQSILVDKVQDNIQLTPFEDISSNKVTLDTRHKNVHFDQELYGLFPEKNKLNNQTKIQYWTLVNVDNDSKTGANISKLKSIGVPLTNFSGIDLALLAQVTSTGSANTTGIDGKGWLINESSAEVSPLQSAAINTKIKTMYIESHYRDIPNKSDISDIPLFSVISTTINDSNLIKLNKPYSMQSIVYTNGKIVDRLDDELSSKFPTSELVQPSFPQCYTEAVAQPSQNTTVRISGLLPNHEIYLGIGARRVAEGITDNFGNSTIQFLIPKDTTPALHLITVGVDKTALTADCELKISDNIKSQAR